MYRYHAAAAMQVTPRGVQLVLGTEQEPAVVDTVVMAIMGYFQLKGRPGALTLRLAQGRSQMLYAVDNSTAGVAPQVCPVTCFGFQSCPGVSSLCATTDCQHTERQHAH